MDDPEHYLLQVLQRTRAGLQDSLIPFHAGKMNLLTERLESSPSLKDELKRLRRVNGFTKAAQSMEWVMERVVLSGEDFSPDQFDLDATMLSDKLFEAFLSEPFDAPTEVRNPEDSAPTNIQTTEIIEPATTEEIPPVTAETAVEEVAVAPEPRVEPEPPPPPVVAPPALADLLDQNLLLGFQRFTEIVSKLGEKTPSERKSVFAVLAMIARSSVDVARAQGKKDVLEFFQSVIKFITYVDSSGSSQDSRVAEIMREVGARLAKALTERSDGPALLQSVNQILQNPESVLKP